MPPFPERESSILAKLKRKKGPGNLHPDLDENRKERSANGGTADHSSTTSNAKVLLLSCVVYLLEPPIPLLSGVYISYFSVLVFSAVFSVTLLSSLVLSCLHCFLLCSLELSTLVCWGSSGPRLDRTPHQPATSGLLFLPPAGPPHPHAPPGLCCPCAALCWAPLSGSGCSCWVFYLSLP